MATSAAAARWKRVSWGVSGGYFFKEGSENQMPQIYPMDRGGKHDGVGRESWVCSNTLNCHRPAKARERRRLGGQARANPVFQRRRLVETEKPQRTGCPRSRPGGMNGGVWRDKTPKPAIIPFCPCFARRSKWSFWLLPN